MSIPGGLVLDVPPLDVEQAEIVSTPVEEIPEAKVFVPVPLVARLTTGVPNVKKLVLRQRELVKKQAAESTSSDSRPPETRIDKFSNSGSMKMRFTAPVKVPDGTQDKIQEQTKENRRRLADGQPPVDSLIQVFAVKEGEEDEDDPTIIGGPIMDAWELLSIDSNGFELQLNFTNPLQVSAGEEPDLLLIQLDMSDFEDENGQKLPESVVKYS